MSNTAMPPHGCYNREPLRDTIIVQTGWTEWIYDGFGNPSRCAVYEEVPNPMTKLCQYTINNEDDPRCTGCQWQGNKNVA